MTDAGELQIHRTRGGHRRIPVPEAIRYVRETKSRIEKPELFGLSDAPSDDSAKSAEAQMLALLRDGHSASVTSLMQSLYAGGLSIAEICDKPIFYAMQQIGSAWPHDKKAIFIEHRAMVLCCRALNQLRLSLPEPEFDAPKAIGGAMSGDVYLLPTLMASLVLHDLGFNETNLGPNLPLDVLTDCLLDERPVLVWIAISEPLRSRTQLQEVVKLAEAAKSLGTKLIVGGRHASDLQRSWGDQPAHWEICQNMQELVVTGSPCLTERQ
jgi:MerR family transcriptional regulator, light-induced transcriptional regulator